MLAMGSITMAMSLAGASARFGQIFYFVVLPILLLAGVGFLLQRTSGLDMPTLTRLNFHFVVPVLIYVSVVRQEHIGEQVWQVVCFSAAMLLALGAVAFVVAWARKVAPDQRNVLMMNTMFYNSGNFGLPMQELAFRPVGLGQTASALQAFVVVVQNLLGFTLGVLLAATGRKDTHWKQNLLHIAKFPPLYALAAAFITLQIRSALGDRAEGAAAALRPFWGVLVTIHSAFLAVALVTLGAQLAVIRRGGRRYPVKLSVLLRLLVGPALGLAMIYAFGLRGFIAQMLLISTASPTAVNTMLMCIKFDHHGDFAAKSVFYSTLLSPVTVTSVIFLAQADVLPGFAFPP